MGATGIVFNAGKLENLLAINLIKTDFPDRSRAFWINTGMYSLKHLLLCNYFVNNVGHIGWVVDCLLMMNKWQTTLSI
jgi:hypothetical protein